MSDTPDTPDSAVLRGIIGRQREANARLREALARSADILEASEDTLRAARIATRELLEHEGVVADFPIQQARK